MIQAASPQILAAVTAPTIEATLVQGTVRPRGVAAMVEERIVAAKSQLNSIAEGIGNFPHDAERIFRTINDEVAVHGVRILPVLVLFVVLGLGAQLLVRRLAAHIHAGEHKQRPVNGVPDRLRLTAQTFVLALLELIAFAVASIGIFVIFDWPPTVRMIVLGLLLAFLGFRAAGLVLQILFQLRPYSVEAPPLPASTIDDPGRVFWYRRSLWLVGAVFFGSVIVEFFIRLGATSETQAFLRAFLGTLILVVSIDSLWRAPSKPGKGRQPVARMLMLTACLVLLWIVWLAEFRVLFLFGLIAILVPVLIRVIDRWTDFLFRPTATDDPRNARYAMIAAIVKRALRSLLFIGVIVYLNFEIGVQLSGARENPTILRIADIILNGVIALVLFDFLWSVTKAYIDKKIADFRQQGVPATEQAIRRHRIGTVLPILRNFLFVFLAAMLVLIYLSSIGVAVAPLIAGASVFGIALGFGSQTLVKDILSGIFYLLDDAFRVGEYIQSGSYMGTVEGFTLRSVRLRHHRGPVFTVPFGELGAIQNMSRDWALEKIVLGVTYDADIAKAKRLIKQVGQELLENAEFAPQIIQTVKMQGIEELGDFAVKLKLKMMTRPGEQAAIRMWVLARIKTLFEENGIDFAYPTVRVAEGKPSAVAGMVHALPKQKPK
jgi:small-conductance mechanosensitive channel